MGEKNLWSKLGLITLLVGMCAFQVYPPEERLKLGIDLGGGHSLLFEIDDSGDKSPDLAERVMAVLKNRVDPQGTRNLVWRPIGRKRLEIQMPRPPTGQKQRREAYEAARDAIVATNISEVEIRNALDQARQERDAAFAAMVGIVKSREALFGKLAAADDRYRQLGEQFRQLQSATQPATRAATQPATQPAMDELALQVDQAFVERNQMIRELLQTNLEVRVLADLLELDKKNKARIDGLQRARDEHPDLVPLIDEMVGKYDDYASDKGVLDDPSDLMRLLRGAGVLEFRILAQRDSSNPDQIDSSDPKYNENVGKYVDQLAEYGPRPRSGDNFQWFKVGEQYAEDFTSPGLGYVVQEYAGATYVLAHATEDMGLLHDESKSWTLRSARQSRDRMGRIAVDFELAGKGPRMFGRLTGNNINRPLCIFLDGEAISSARINDQIFDRGQITGSFTDEYVRYLVNTLEAGTLPARLKEVPLQQKSIGPTLGETNRSKGQQAIIVAFIVTIAFMALYYAYSGLVADIALLMNLVITLGLMSFIQATFTLPGIAGLILMLGMAVDANVLIYERIREELERGVSVRMAVKLGYEKAFSAILDSNVTTIITAVILASLGSEEIKGFGLTLGLGLCTSMFTALFVTRQFFHIMVPNTLNREETRRAWLGTGIVAVAAAALLGLGYLFNAPAERAESTLIGLGRFLVWLLGAGALLMIALWSFRILYRALGHQTVNKLPMMRLFSAPSIDWMGKYRVFWTASGVIIICGFIFFNVCIQHKEDFLDIEFVGGTSVQVELKDELKGEFEERGDEKLLARIVGNDPDDASTSVGWLRYAADQLEKAEVTAAGDGRYVLSKPERLTVAQVQTLLLPTLEGSVIKGGIAATEDGPGVAVQFKQLDKRGKPLTVDLATARERIRQAAEAVRSAAEKMRGTRVQLVEEETSTGEIRQAFEIITTETQRTLVAEALLASMGASGADILQVTQPIEGTVVRDPTRARNGVFFPIQREHNVLSEVIGGQVQESIAEYKGGVVLVFDNLEPPPTTGEIEQRLQEMRLQPDFEELSARNPKVIGLEPAEGSTGSAQETRFKRIAIAVNDPALPCFDDEETWLSSVAQKELALAQAALASTRTLQRVTQFAPQVAEEATTKAIIAIILSLIAIAGYLWMRFGSVQFGLAGIIALYHDVAITLACVMACHYLHDTAIGKLLGLEDFKIDLSMIAAFLTIVGYSINDSIVIFDRIRENRGRLATVSAGLINNSINQTLSRTLITSFTTFVAVVVMYLLGGTGIHGFAFALIVGCLTGTYSTIAIATPMLNHPRAMWVITIILAAVTTAGLVLLIPIFWVKCTLVALILAAAIVGLVKQIAGAVSAAPARYPGAA